MYEFGWYKVGLACPSKDIGRNERRSMSSARWNYS